jgi:hypothetical protein
MHAADKNFNNFYTTQKIWNKQAEIAINQFVLFHICTITHSRERTTRAIWLFRASTLVECWWITECELFCTRILCLPPIHYPELYSSLLSLSKNCTHIFVLCCLCEKPERREKIQVRVENSFLRMQCLIFISQSRTTNECDERTNGKISVLDRIERILFLNF